MFNPNLKDYEGGLRYRTIFSNGCTACEKIKKTIYTMLRSHFLA